MNIKNKLLVIYLIVIIVIGLFALFGLKERKYKERADVKIQILLYHNFLTTIPENDPDNFNYINTPESFEENVKTLLEKGYTFNVKASIFIITDRVGQEIDGIKYLGWNECLEMQNSGLVEIFSHSKKHVFYDKRPV